MIDFLTQIEMKQRRINEELRDIEILKSMKEVEYPYIYPYEDLDISSFYRYSDWINISFSFKNDKLTLDEKEDFAINFIDELGGCPQPGVLGGSGKPSYYINSHEKIMIKDIPIGISFIMGSEVPGVYEIKIVEKTRYEKVCEVSCRNK